MPDGWHSVMKAGRRARGRVIWRSRLVRSDGTASLARLAKETGGLLLENTNDVERIGRRIAEDQASHYLLAYTPARGEMDGTYRRVTVKVKRQGAAVTHRSGDWAVTVTP